MNHGKNNKKISIASSKLIDIQSFDFLAAYFTMSQHAPTTNCTLSNIDPSFYSSSSSSLTAYSDKLRNSFICWASPDCDITSPASHPLPRHSPSVYPVNNCDKLNQAAAASGGTDLNFGTNLRLVVFKASCFAHNPSCREVLQDFSMFF